MNDYFVDITKPLGVLREEDSTTVDNSSQDTLQTTVEHFQPHPSVIKIISTVNRFQSLSFHQITVQEMFGQLIKLDPKKTTQQDAIPAKVL